MRGRGVRDPSWVGRWQECETQGKAHNKQARVMKVAMGS